MILHSNDKGVSIIAAIFIIVILAFMGVMFLTLFTSSSSTSVNDLQSAQALAVAEGGVEFHQLNLAVNLDWYRSATDPVSTDTRNLGTGSFTVSTTLPATKLRAQVTAAGVNFLNPLRVYSVARFPNTGCVRIENEFISYGAVGTTAAACNPNSPPCFYNLTRGAGACYGGGTTDAHSRGDSVYPVVNLTQAGGLPSSCADLTSFTIAANTKLLSAGTLDIEGEEISYSGSSTAGGTMTLTGVQRCLGTIGPMAHALNCPVTPVLDNGDSADYQAEMTSTGTVGAAVRTVNKTVQR